MTHLRRTYVCLVISLSGKELKMLASIVFVHSSSLTATGASACTRGSPIAKPPCRIRSISEPMNLVFNVPSEDKCMNNKESLLHSLASNTSSTW